MADSAALLVDEILLFQPMRQWVLGNCSRHGSTSHIHVVVSVPFPLRFLFASQPAVMGQALGIIYRAISTHLAHEAGFAKSLARTGAVTLVQRFGGALNLNILCGAPHKIFHVKSCVMWSNAGIAVCKSR